MKCAIDGIGLIGPGLAGWEASRAILAGAAYDAQAATVIAAPAMLPPAERRRVGVPVKLALAVGMEAALHAQRDPAALPTVFASSSCDPDNVHEICLSLAENAREVSPTRFHNSVHNAPSGYWSIAAKARAPSTSLACHDWTFAAGLLEAAAQLVHEAESVLLIAYDSPYPQPIAPHHPMIAPVGVALVLARAPGAHSLAQLEISLEAGAQDDAMADPALDTLRLGNPAARALPLLAALARGGQHTVRLAHVAGNSVRLSVGALPC